MISKVSHSVHLLIVALKIAVWESSTSFISIFFAESGYFEGVCGCDGFGCGSVNASALAHSMHSISVDRFACIAIMRPSSRHAWHSPMNSG